eukprot:6193157-Pleurochrysis_carterae.AAC.4
MGCKDEVSPTAVVTNSCGNFTADCNAISSCGRCMDGDGRRCTIRYFSWLVLSVLVKDVVSPARAPCRTDDPWASPSRGALYAR